MKRITTEAEWRACKDPRRLVELLGDRPSDRKYRLLMVACCRLLWDALPDPRSRAGVDAAERFADSPATAAELNADRAAAFAIATELTSARPNIKDLALQAAWAAFEVTNVGGLPGRDLARTFFKRMSLPPGRTVPRRAMAALVRCVAGNPFRPAPTFAPEWRTPTVLAVARRVYDERSFHDLPVLADALQDAGCDGEQLLAHLRDDGVHTRGRWALDLATGRE